MKIEHHYIYSWNIIDENGFLHPFYIGAGKYTEKRRYRRSIEPHYNDFKHKNKNRAQYKREKNLDNFYVLIEFDNLTLVERNNFEISLIHQYGRLEEQGILYNLTKGGEFNPMFDYSIKLLWETTIPKMKISQPNRKEIEYNGVVYISKKELARFLGISSQLLNYRIKNNIPVDLIPNKSNDPNNKKCNRKRNRYGNFTN